MINFFLMIDLNSLKLATPCLENVPCSMWNSSTAYTHTVFKYGANKSVTGVINFRSFSTRGDKILGIFLYTRLQTSYTLPCIIITRNSRFCWSVLTLSIKTRSNRIPLNRLKSAAKHFLGSKSSWTRFILHD